MSDASSLPLRAGPLPVADLIALYMAHYTGRDTTRAQRLGWWKQRIGALPFQEVTDDHIHAALEALAGDPARRWAGKDADGLPIFKAAKKPMAPATINRYAAALAAVFTWSIRRRVAPKGWDHPGRRVERRTEDNEHTRFLSEEECRRLLDACKASPWPKLYVLVLLALTTGARKGELLAMRWCDVDLAERVVYVARSKNGDPKVLPLVPAVVEQLQAMQGGPAALVFASKQRPGQAYAFEGRWAEALRMAKVRNFRYHDLRHSAASRLARQGATLLEIADLLGHRQISMSKRYSHLSSGHRSALVNRVSGDLR